MKRRGKTPNKDQLSTKSLDEYYEMKAGLYVYKLNELCRQNQCKKPSYKWKIEKVGNKSKVKYYITQDQLGVSVKVTDKMKNLAKYHSAKLAYEDALSVLSNRQKLEQNLDDQQNEAYQLKSVNSISKANKKELIPALARVEQDIDVFLESESKMYTPEKSGTEKRRTNSVESNPIEYSMIKKGHQYYDVTTPAVRAPVSLPNIPLPKKGDKPIIIDKAFKPTEKMAVKSIEKTDEKSIKKSVEQPDLTPTVRSTEKTDEKSIKKSVEQPDLTPTVRSTEKTDEKSIKKSVEQADLTPTVKSTEKTDEKIAEKSIKKPVELSDVIPTVKSTEKTAEKSIKKPVGKTAEKSIKKPIEVPDVTPTVKSIEKTDEKTDEKSIKKSVEQRDLTPTVKSTEKTDEKTTEKSIKKPVGKTAEKSIKKPIEVPGVTSNVKSTEITAEKSIKKPVEVPDVTPTVKPIEKTIAKPIEKTAEKSIKKPVEKTVEKPTEKAFEKPIEIQKPVESHDQTPTVKPIEKPTEKLEKSIRFEMKEDTIKKDEDSIKKVDSNRLDKSSTLRISSGLLRSSDKLSRDERPIKVQIDELKANDDNFQILNNLHTIRSRKGSLQIQPELDIEMLLYLMSKRKFLTEIVDQIKSDKESSNMHYLRLLNLVLLQNEKVSIEIKISSDYGRLSDRISSDGKGPKIEKAKTEKSNITPPPEELRSEKSEKLDTKTAEVSNKIKKSDLKDPKPDDQRRPSESESPINSPPQSRESSPKPGQCEVTWISRIMCFYLDRCFSTMIGIGRTTNRSLNDAAIKMILYLYSLINYRNV